MKNCFITICFLLSISTPCFTQEKVIIASNDYEPYTSSERNGSGFILDVVKEAFKEVGVNVVYEFYPWKRCEHYVKIGKAFATTPYIKTEKRIKEYDFSDPITYTYNKFFYNKDKFPGGFNWKRIEDFKKYIIGGTLGYWYVPVFKKSGLTVFYSSEKKNFMLLMRQRIDFIVIDELTGLGILKKNFTDDDKIKILKKPLLIKKYHLLISRKYPRNKELTMKFNKGLKLIKRKIIYKKLMNLYKIPKEYTIR